VPGARAWLERHPRWTFHFTPISCSWLNAVEGFFAELTQRRLKGGAFHSFVDLQAAFNRFIAEHNTQAKPFVWKAEPDKIIAVRNRGFPALNQSTSRISYSALSAAFILRMGGWR
jgi:transposase